MQKVKVLGLALIIGSCMGVSSVVDPTMASAVTQSKSVQSKQLSAPKVKEVNTTAFLMSWGKVSGAHHYQIQVSKASNFKNAKVQDRYDHGWSGAVSQNTTYYARYRAVFKNKGKVSYGAWSKVLKTKTKAKTPTSFTTKVKSVNNGSVVSWSKPSYVTKYKVVLSDNKALNKNTKTYWTTKNKYTVPLNSRDGQVKYAKVFAYNGSVVRQGQLMEVFAKPLAVSTGEEIRVATQNILCSDCTVKGVNNADIAWMKREPIHLAEVKKNAPDVLFLQEAWNANNALTSFYGKVNGLGYVEAHKNLSYTGGGYSNRIYYKKSKYTQLASDSFDVVGDKRGATWALLKSNKTGKRFYVVSTHFSPFVSAKQRADSADLVNKRMNALNKGNLPMIVGGDMNSKPNEALVTSHTSFIKNGWTDAGSAVKTKNRQYSTHTGFTKGAFNPEYERLDYLYSKNIGGWSYYENVVTVSKNKITSKHGSDHNMVVGVTRLK